MDTQALKEICYNCMAPLPRGIHVCPSCGFERSSYQSPPEALPPETILGGRYLLGKTLGIGGFGITYLALDLKSGRKAAVKEYFPSGLVERQVTRDGTLRVIPLDFEGQKIFQSGVQEYLKEGEHLAMFQKVPNIVSVQAYFTENDTAYLVMDYVDGMTVAEYLKRYGPMDPDQAVGYLLPILKSLVVMHANHMIHRDISPANIMLAKGTATLIDFGASRNFLNMRMAEGRVELKPGYTPIEQYSPDGSQGPWTDVYALCATLYRMITGRLPTESVKREQGADLSGFSELGIAIAPELERIIFKGMEVQPQNRYQNLLDLYDAFSRYAASRHVLGEEERQVSRMVELEEEERDRESQQGDVENLEEEKDQTAEIQRKNRMLKILGAALGGGCLICLLAFLVFQSTKEKAYLQAEISAFQEGIRIPNLEGKDVDQAEKELEALGLHMAVVEVNYSETIPRGQITGQEPERGEKADSGDTVKVVRSGGTQETMVKNLVGMTREEAEKWIKSQNLAGQVEWLEDVQNDELYSEEYEEGTILSQSEEANSLYVLGSGSLKLAVCQGSLGEKTDKIAVPDLTGKTLAEAADILAQSPGEQGYTFALADETEWKEEFSWEYEPGQIISQEPKAGQKARTNKCIQLTVARELRQAEVPDVYGMSLEDAEQALEEAHFVVASEGHHSDMYPEGTIYDVSAEEEGINPGDTKTFLEKTTITVTYSEGPEITPTTEKPSGEITSETEKQKHDPTKGGSESEDPSYDGTME